MSQTHIILVRHGEASAGWSTHPDPGLSAQGRQQARTSGRSLINELSYYQLLSSPKKKSYGDHGNNDQRKKILI